MGAGDDLTRALLLEEAASKPGVAEALFTSVSGAVPLLQALIDSGATDPDTLGRYLARSEAPFVRQVVPLDELVDQLPRGLCTRLLAVPIRRDPVTGTIDVAVADAFDAHPAEEIHFHLRAPIRLVRAPLQAVEEALRRVRIRLREDRPVDRFREAAENASREHENELYDSRRTDAPPPERPRHALLLEPDSSPPSAVAPGPKARVRTPPWGTPIHVHEPTIRSEPTDAPKGDYGSEIPIPLTRKSLRPMSGGTQHPPPTTGPARSALGEGYAIDTTGFRDVVEKGRIELPSIAPLGSFIPGPPPLPRSLGSHAPQLPFPEMTGVLAALRNAGSRDEVLELLLVGARMVALKVALFIVKKGGYLGWAGSQEFGERSALQAVMIPLDASSIFDRATREDVYLGPIPRDEVHAPLLRVLRDPSRDVAGVPVRVSGRTAVIIIADELGDTMIGTRRLEELARAAGEAFTRIVRSRR